MRLDTIMLASHCGPPIISSDFDFYELFDDFNVSTMKMIYEDISNIGVCYRQMDGKRVYIYESDFKAKIGFI